MSFIRLRACLSLPRCWEPAAVVLDLIVMVTVSCSGGACRNDPSPHQRVAQLQPGRPIARVSQTQALLCSASRNQHIGAGCVFERRMELATQGGNPASLARMAAQPFFPRRPPGTIV